MIPTIPRPHLPQFPTPHKHPFLASKPPASGPSCNPCTTLCCTLLVFGSLYGTLVGWHSPPHQHCLLFRCCNVPCGILAQGPLHQWSIYLGLLSERRQWKAQEMQMAIIKAGNDQITNQNFSWKSSTKVAFFNNVSFKKPSSLIIHR